MPSVQRSIDEIPPESKLWRLGSNCRVPKFFIRVDRPRYF